MHTANLMTSFHMQATNDVQPPTNLVLCLGTLVPRQKIIYEKREVQFRNSLKFTQIQPGDPDQCGCLLCAW